MNALRLTLSLFAAIGFLAGCGGSQPAIGTPGAMPQSHAIATQRLSRGSLIAPETKGQDLLYVSRSGTARVYFYTYPGGRLVGSIPGGGSQLCSDHNGNVFVAATDVGVVEWAHGGTKPIAVFSDPNIYAQACAVDPVSGNLGVVGYTVASHEGVVAVYQSTQSTPTVYTDEDSGGLFHCTYDDQGNLFATRLGRVSDGRLVELPRGSGSLTYVSIGHAFAGLGHAVQWDGSYVAVGDRSVKPKGPGQVYQVRVSGSMGAVVNTVGLSERSKRPPALYEQFWIQNKTIIAPNVDNTLVGFWRYPKGGEPKHSLKPSKSEGAISGLTVSVGK
jgi:hypothetical protein